MRDFTMFKSLIKTRLAELDTRLHGIEAELDQPKPKSFGEQAIDIEDDEVLEGVGLAAQREVALLYMALTRIEGGTYGICKGCGDPISDARLIAVPHAMLCRNCAQTRAR